MKKCLESGRGEVKLWNGEVGFFFFLFLFYVLETNILLGFSLVMGGIFRAVIIYLVRSLCFT